MKTRKTFYEQNGGTYTQVGDVLILNLTIGEGGQQPIGKYGRMRKRYLKERHPVLYSELLLSGKLYSHLLKIDDACEERMELLTQQMAKREGVTEVLKAVGSPHEQHPQSGGRDRPVRAHLLLREVLRC